MLDDRTLDRVRSHLDAVVHPVELVASLGDDPRSHTVAALLEQIVGLSPMIVLRDGAYERRPSFAVQRTGTDISVRFAGVPLGHQFSSLVLALLHVGGHPPKVSDEAAARIRSLRGDLRFETYFALSCRSCPEVVQALNVMSVLNPLVRHTAVNGASFPDEVETRQVTAVPDVHLNGEPFAQGRMGIEQILERLATRV